MNKEAFVYCWTDHLRNMIYVGYHKGSIDDGYICSSKLMLEQFRERPQDFTRQIIASGSKKDMTKLETKILISINAKNDKSCYNQHNGNGFYYLKERTKEHNTKISESNKNKKASAETRLKMSVAKKGKPSGRITSPETKNKIANTLKGRKHSEESIEKMREAKKDFKHTEESKIKIGLSFENRPLLTCPHCNKEGKGGAMMRYHFDNCKHKVKEVA